MDYNSSGSNCNAQLGPPIEDIQTEGIGFLAISGEVKLQLLPTPWPRDNLPPPTSSLMSIASKTGILAAAGPEGIILASTESLRKAFFETQLQNGQLQRFEPQLKIPMSFRISQVVFSSDEKFLILSAESGGGLAVYEVSSIMKGSQQSVFELPTSGKALRVLMPNPAPEKAELLAVITTDGNLMVANLKERSFVVGAQGLVLKDSVSSMSWSTKGKQLVAGLGDGTAYQMTPEGELKAVIPRPPDIGADHHISSILWLENHMFLSIFTPSSFDQSQAPHAKLYITTRTNDCKNYKFQKVSDPVQPFGLNRSPPHHFMLRLREFPPNLQDIIIMASTASTDIGLLTRSKVPLTNGKPPEKVTGVFTMTELSDDSRRAQLPFSAQFGDTSPIGFALDLSSRENVPRPIPGDEISETSCPVPCLTLLNNEGVLASWWVIYSESVRQKTAYPGLALEPESNSTSVAQNSSPFGGNNLSSTNNNKAFGTNTFATVLGEPRPTPTFGSSSQLKSGSTFGAPSALGTQTSAWGSTPPQNILPTSTPEFGKTAFGSNQNTPSMTSFSAPTFGKPSIPSFGIQKSVWGTPVSNTSSNLFGSNTGNGKVTSLFGSTTKGTSNSESAPSGFASFASTNEFGKLVSQSSTMESVLKNQSLTNPTTSHMNPTHDKQAVSSANFGLGSTGAFVLGTTFKNDPVVESNLSPIEPDQSNELFGNTFANALGGTAVLLSSNTKSEQPQNNHTDKVEDQNIDHSDPSLSLNLMPKKMPLLSSQSNVQSVVGISKTPENECSDENVYETGNNFQQKPAFNSGQNALPGVPDADTSNLSISDRTTQQDSPAEENDDGEDDSVSSTIQINEKVNQDLSPESSYEIIENNDFINTSKPRNPTRTGLLFGEIKSLSNKQDTNISFSSNGQLTISDKAKSSESLQSLKESSFVLQPTAHENEDRNSKKTIVTELKSLEHHSHDNYDDKLSQDKARNDKEANKDSEQEKKKDSQFLAQTEAELKRHTEIVAQREAEEKRRNAIVAQRKAEEKRHNELVAQREAEEKRRNEIVALRKAEEKRHKELLARWEAEEKCREELKAQKELEEKQAFVDSDDTCMQKFLASDLEPTTRLNDFVAHSDYVSALTVESVPAQVEAVYRDINSMIDTLGLNTRSLHEFILGHCRKQNQLRRSRNDLNDDSIWILGDIEALSSIVENELSDELENGRIKDIDEKLEICKELQKDLIKLRAKHVDIKKIIATSQDPNCLAIARAQPLGVKQATQQHDLRQNFMKLQRLLSEAEEGITILKAKVVAQTVMNQKSNSSTGPTVEAIMRTITKLTSMAEKKSGDIDVLEGQLRKLKVTMSTSCIDDLQSPTTPTKLHKSLYRNKAVNSFSCASLTQDQLKTSSSSNLLSSSMTLSNLQVLSPPRRTLTCYSAEEKAHLRYSIDKKRRVKKRLRLACQNLGIRVRLVDNDI